MGASIGERMFFRNRGSPTDNHRRGNVGGDDRSKGGCVSDVTNLASRGAFRVIVVVPQTYRRGKQEEKQSGAGS
jgi:hypothetical protein